MTVTTSTMAEKSAVTVCKAKISQIQPKPVVLPVKIRRKICKSEDELLKNWPRDAILKWDDFHVMCEICGVYCSNLSNLRRHQKIHNGEQLACLLCPDCNKKYSRADNLVRHIKDYCPVVRAREAAPRPVSAHSVYASNQIIQNAVQTKKFKTPAWALIPLDLPIDVEKPRKRSRIASKQTVNIPLTKKAALTNPRAPTPITEDDVKLLESFLELDPEPQTSNTSSSRTPVEIVFDSREKPETIQSEAHYEVTKEDDEWLKGLLISDDDPWKNQPVPTKEERKISLASNLCAVTKRPPPPWEKPHPADQALKYITHNDELYLVLDELRE